MERDRHTGGGGVGGGGAQRREADWEGGHQH